MREEEETHRFDPKPIIEAILRPTLESGGEVRDVLELLESVVAGVLTITIKPDGDEAVLNAFVHDVRQRMATIRRGLAAQ